MAVYEMNKRSIAEYLSDTRNEFVLGCNPSEEGQRRSKNGDTYPIKVVELSTTQNIVPKVDCFLNADETIAVRVYLPKYTYFVKTRELHKSYSSRDRLSFSFYANPKSFEYTLPKFDVKFYEDFKEAMDDLTQKISSMLKHDINQFRTNEEWTITGINVDVTVDIHSMSTK